jgi:hypothetical protein
MRDNLHYPQTGRHLKSEAVVSAQRLPFPPSTTTVQVRWTDVPDTGKWLMCSPTWPELVEFLYFADQ